MYPFWVRYVSDWWSWGYGLDTRADQSWNIFYVHSFPSADSRGTVVGLWWKSAQVLNNSLKDCLPRKIVIMWTDQLNMALIILTGLLNFKPAKSNIVFFNRTYQQWKEHPPWTRQDPRMCLFPSKTYKTCHQFLHSNHSASLCMRIRGRYKPQTETWPIQQELGWYRLCHFPTNGNDVIYIGQVILTKF